MEWWMILLLIFGGLIFLMATGMPVAFSFLLVCLVGVYLLWGGIMGLEQLISSLKDSVSMWSLVPLPLFILMGDVMFHSNVAPLMIDALDKWIGKVPGRLSLLAIATGALLSCLTGASMASVAMLGSAMTPEMTKRGYKDVMSLGPILGSGGLAIMIPPSGLAVLVATIAKFSVGKFLVAIIVPGILMAALFALYVIIRCTVNPQLAPRYEVAHYSLAEKLKGTVQYILPIGLVVFLVVGVILLGIATPTEAAATGTVGCIILAIIYRRFSLSMMKNAIKSTLETTGMMFLIVAASTAFSQILSFSGAVSGMVDFATGMHMSPIMIVIVSQVIIFILGMFMGAIPIVLITVPIFFPMIMALGYDPLWYGVLFLINIEISPITPPFGLSLFVLKGVTQGKTKMVNIWKAALPFIILDVITMGLVMVIPGLALWLTKIA